MSSWSLDIIRQGPLDLWTIICIVASLVLLTYALVGRLWQSARGIAALVLIAIGVGGTALVLLVPPLHEPFVGLVWTFALLGILSATFYLNLQPQLGTTRTSLLLGLRIVALALLVPMLFEPVLRFVPHFVPQRPLIVLVDTSGSMSVPDVANGPSRIQSVWQALQPQLPRISDHFVPQFMTFDTASRSLVGADDLAHLAANGQSTDIVAGVSAAWGKSSRSDTTVLLFSDGQDNTTPDTAGVLARSHRPVNTVTVGSDQAEPAGIPNVAVAGLDVPDDFVVGHSSDVTANIQSSALNDRMVEVKMSEVDDASKPIGDLQKQTLVLKASAAGQNVVMQFTPHSTGVHRVAVWIDPIPGERTTVDNRQEFQGLALDPRIHVLYIEGRARPEYRELFRDLGHDSNIELAALLRIQAERFSASGTVDGEPFKTMPTTAEQWKRFDVILLGDLDSSFLPPAQQALIEARVSAGGGLVMIGGQNNFGPGGYKGGAIERALPVFAGDQNSPQESSLFVPQLTDVGLGNPAMEGLSDWFGSAAKKATQDLPPLRGNVVVGPAKSGAQILLTHPQRNGPDGSPQIVLAVQRFGQGRTAAFTADTTYLWYLPLRGLGQESPFNRFWGQLVRWLTGEDVRNRQNGAGIVGLLNKTVYQFGETVRVRAMVRDERGDTTSYANVTLKLTPAGPAGTSTTLKPSEGRTGMYETTLPNLSKGQYSIELSASRDGKMLGTQTLKFTVIPPADEMLKIAANPQLMSKIADQTGGLSCRLSELPGMIDELIRADPAAATIQPKTVPLCDAVRLAMLAAGQQPQWPGSADLPLEGALVVIVLAAEWILRRHWQLP